VTNQGWRIASIPHDDPTKTKIIKTNPIALLGMVVFLAGIVAFFNVRGAIPIALVIVGLVIMGGGVWLAKARQQRNWITVTAKCLDHEVQKRLAVSPGSDAGSHPTWEFRLLCELEHKGRTVQVTPTYWRSFATEDAAEEFLAAKIDANGKLQLRVNPDNPLQVALA
jgi:hypothetical protein